ncbi:hypothetical protein IGI04_028422 [Brassica rapa subsp. trilocularis]|uniref:Uncharacterized protein n=1 Tax=Brassica rapa subsp. trilocularis TaxID=1813537 RepID=A0ABQ7L1V9_BRACM|nr:hypothetical protein IGI04_028422 [Brassica rapa subsp. trilocularis]
MSSSGPVVVQSSFYALRLDVVGKIPFVQGSDLKDRFVIEPGLISSGDRTQSVMVVTTVNPKIFGGNLLLNSTPATQFYFDTNFPAIAEFTASLGDPVGEAFPCINTKEGIRKKKHVSIGDLNKFFTNSDEHGEMLQLTLDETFNTGEALIVGGEAGEAFAYAINKVESEKDDTNPDGVKDKEVLHKRTRE